MAATVGALAGLTLNVSILQGRDLIAKDRSLMGKRTTSDPFVKVFFGNKFVGKTKVIRKTCSPTWNETLTLSLGANEATELLRSVGKETSTISTLYLQIFDYDTIGENDPMGVATIPVQLLEPSTESKWYAVGKGSGSIYCKNAQGDIQVQVTFAGRQMRDVQRGTKQILRDRNITVGLAWDVERGQKVDLDSSVVAVDQWGAVNMEETVYYGNLVNSNRSLCHSGDETTGDAAGDDETIHVQLDRLPPHILALYFILSVATPGKTFADVKSAQARFISTSTKEGICRFVPSNMGQNTALFLVRISREAAGWALMPIQEGSEYARDFGSLIPELKGYTRDLVPGLTIDPTERIAVMRKGGTIRVRDYLPANSIPEWVTFGLAWDVTNFVNIDLDASAIILDDDFEPLDLVFFRQLSSKDGSIQHSGDEREGDEAGDDEKISVSLDRVSADAKYIGFVINSYSGQELDDVSRASCHLFDKATHNEIAKYTLSNAKALDKHTALVMGCLYRTPEGDWNLRIISEPAQGRTAHENVDELQNFLRRNPPPPLISSPPPMEDEEIDLSVMPEAEISLEDEEIVVVPEGDLAAYVPPSSSTDGGAYVPK